MNITQFNQLSASEAKAVTEGCVAIQRWQQQMADARPFQSLQHVLDSASEFSQQWQQPELLEALSAHPRIGEKAQGQQAHERASRSEQSAMLSADSDIKQAMAAGNLAYEARFGRIFLIRAKGRSPQEILDQLQQRLSHNDSEELQETLQQLREITLLRLQEVFS